MSVHGETAQRRWLGVRRGRPHTFCQAEGWELKGSLLACPGWMDQVVHVFRATGLSPLADRYPGAGPFAAEDGLTVVPVPVVGFRALVRAGTIRDARTIAAVLLAL